MRDRQLDTSVVVDALRQKQGAVVARMRSADEQALSISVVAVGELLVSIEKSGDEEARLELETVLRRLRKVPVDERIAGRYGELRAQLEIQGQRMSDNDLWIAATALVHDAILVTADEAFSRVPGLTTENWRLG